MTVEFPQAEHEFPLGLRGNAHRPGNLNHLALVNPPVAPLPEPRTTPWHRTSASTFDQQGSSCTAQSAIGVLTTLPFRYQFQPDRDKFDTEAERHAAYQRWQRWDPWPGGELESPYYEGSSTDAPFIGLRAEGIILGWSFLMGEAQVWEWVSRYSPVSVGTIWRNDMSYPDSNGYIHATGPEVGGHAYELAFASHPRQAYRIINSWSTAWGENGRAWISRSDMAGLLADDGEAVTIRL